MPVEAGCEPLKYCILSLLLAPKEVLEGNPPASADYAGLPAEAGGCDGGDGVGIALGSSV